MKKIFTLLTGIALTASTMAQVVADSAVTGASYINDVFYSLNNSTVRTEPRDNWDLGFEITGNTSSILANTQGNARVYQSPFAVAAWNTFDTAGFAAWQRLDNSPENWSEGALNRNAGAGGGFDLGWGIYDINGVNGPAHAVNGDSIFLVKLANGTFKKLRIDRLYNSEYSFTYANIDGQNEVTDTLAKSAYTGKNFGYFSIANNSELDREPATADWDLLFTRYITYDYSFGPGTPQAVTGVLLNKNVKAVKIKGVHQNDLVWENYIDSFNTEKNVIGHNWKAVNLSPPPTWLLEDSLTYLIRRPANGEVWKLVFTSFGGSGSGKYFFNKELLLAAPASSVTAANLTVCSGDTVTLNANTGNGFTYQWYKGANVIGGATSATLLVTQPGNYSVKVFDRGAFSQSTAVTVVVNPLPSSTIAASLNPTCAGSTNGSISINATGGTGSHTYTWTGTTATGAQAQNLGAGVFKIVVADSLGCLAAELNVTLTEPAALTASASAQGSNATVTASGGTSPYTYLWDDANNQTTATATNLANGTYSVTITDANGCTTSSSAIVVISGTNELAEKLQLRVYPNPASDQLNVQFINTTASDVKIQLCDVAGRVVWEQTQMNVSQFNQNVLLNGTESGVYVLRLQCGSQVVNQRVVIE